MNGMRTVYSSGQTAISRVSSPMRRAAFGALPAIVASCAAPPPDVKQPAPQVPVAASPASEPKPEPTGLGEPWASASEWSGEGIPPKQFSLFDIPARSPVLAYAALDRDACEAELRRRDIAFERADATPGVLAPIRLRGPLHAVTAHSMSPAKLRASSNKELIDCRLALSLDDFAADLAAREITGFEWSS